MDFDLSAEQQNRLAAVDEIVEACGGPARALAVAQVNGHDGELDAKLASAGLLDGASMLDRVLLAEHLAEAGLATTFGLRAVLGGDGSDVLPEGAVAVLDARRRGPVRFGAAAEVVVVLDGDAVRVQDDVAHLAPRPVPSSFGYPYAELDRAAAAGARTVAIEGAELRRRLRLALAAEVSGTSAAGIAHTAQHLRTRTQFGRSLSTFQALRHRLAEAAVSAEGVRWMVREAASGGDARAATLAAWSAGVTAASIAPELTQMCGARGFALDFGLHVYTMRLEGLRLELGGPDRLAAELASTRRG